MLSEILLDVYGVVLLLATFCWALVFFSPRHSKRLMRGKHISRPLVRRVATPGAWGIRAVVMLLPTVLWLTDTESVYFRAVVFLNSVWCIDDFFTGEDKDREGKLAENLRRWLGALRPLGYDIATAPQGSPA